MSDKLTSILKPETSVLIVDDSKDYSLVLERILASGLGYKEIVKVDTTQEAYAQLKDHPEKFDLLFIDYHFPDGTSGKDLVQTLQQQGMLEHKITFWITAEPDLEKAKEAVEVGLAGVVVKPFDRKQLRSQLERVERDLQMAAISEE